MLTQRLSKARGQRATLLYLTVKKLRGKIYIVIIQ